MSEHEREGFEEDAIRPRDPDPDFDGETFERKHDKGRLRRQLHQVRELMLDGEWRTFEEIAIALNREYPWQSISARLRDLRKVKFGAYDVLRRRRGAPKDGLFEYRVLAPEQTTPQPAA